MNCMLKGLLGLVFIFPFFVSAQTPVSVNFNYSIGLENFGEFDDFEQPFRVIEDDYTNNEVAYSSWVFNQFSVGGEYKILPYIDAGLQMGYAYINYDPGKNGNAAFSISSDLDITDFRIQPKIGFDALFKNENEALKLNLGLNLFYRNQGTRYFIESDTARSGVVKDIEINRVGWGSGFFTGLEWEDYFAPHFAYFLSFRYYFPYDFKPKKVILDHYILDGNKVEVGVKELSSEQVAQSFNNGEAEYFSIENAIYINIGLKYRF